MKVSLWFRVQALGFEITRLETLNPDRSMRQEACMALETTHATLKLVTQGLGV